MCIHLCVVDLIAFIVNLNLDQFFRSLLQMICGYIFDIAVMITVKILYRLLCSNDIRFDQSF